MPALGHKGTFAPQNVMSALPPRQTLADLVRHECLDVGAELREILGGGGEAHVEDTLARSPQLRINRFAGAKSAATVEFQTDRLIKSIQ